MTGRQVQPTCTKKKTSAGVSWFFEYMRITWIDIILLLLDLTGIVDTI